MSPPLRRPIWRRRWVALASGAFLLCLAAVLVTSGPAWARRLGLVKASRRPKSSLPSPSLIGSLDPKEILNELVSKTRPSAEHALDLGKAPVAPLLEQQTAAPPDLPLGGTIAPCLSIAGDSARGLLLAGSIDGALQIYEKETLRLIGTRRLRQPAYQMELDSSNGLLFAASVASGRLRAGTLSDNDVPIASIDVYQLDSGNSTRPLKAPELTWVQSFDVNARISPMYRTADGSGIHFLVSTSQKVFVGKIDTRGWKLVEGVALAQGGANAFAQSPDGATLYALANGSVHVIEANGGKITGSLRVGPSVVGLSAGENGRVFLLERRNGSIVQSADFATSQVNGYILHSVDFSTWKLLGSWAASMDGRVCLRSSPDGKRIYLSNSTVLDASIRQLDAGATQPSTSVLLGQANSNRDWLVRGMLFVSPDGGYVISGSGLVFRARS